MGSSDLRRTEEPARGQVHERDCQRAQERLQVARRRALDVARDSALGAARDRVHGTEPVRVERLLEEDFMADPIAVRDLERPALVGRLVDDRPVGQRVARLVLDRDRDA